MQLVVNLLHFVEKKIVSWLILKNNLYAEIIEDTKWLSELQDVRRGELSVQYYGRRVGENRKY